MRNKPLLNLIMLVAFWGLITMRPASSSSSDLDFSIASKISSATSSISSIEVQGGDKVRGLSFPITRLNKEEVEEFHISNVEAARCSLKAVSAKEKKASTSFSSLLILPPELLLSILEVVTTKPASLKRVCKTFDQLIGQLISQLISQPSFASRFIAGVIFEEYGNKKIWHGNDNSIVITLIKTPEILQDIPSFLGIDVLFGIDIIRFKRDLTRSEWEETLKIFETCRGPDLNLDTHMTYLGTVTYPVQFIYCTDGYFATSEGKRDEALRSIFFNKDFSGDRPTSKVSLFEHPFLS